MDDEIGTAAGTIWRQLHEDGELTLAKLKQRTKLTDRLLLMGLGWLAREGKIRFVRVKQTLRVSLKKGQTSPSGTLAEGVSNVTRCP